jgi:hypothetical protein
MKTIVFNLPFPPLPQNIVDQVKLPTIDGTMPRITYYLGNGIFRAFKYNNTEVYDWVVANVTPNVVYNASETVSVEMAPHIDCGSANQQDPGRYYNLFYTTQNGGNPVVMKFYEEIAPGTNPGPHYQASELRVIETINLQENTWYLMNTRCIYSVEGISTERITLGLSFPDPTLPPDLAQYW